MAEALKILFLSYEEAVPPGGSEWYEQYVAHAKQKNMLQDIPDEPHRPITRGEMAHLIRLQENGSAPTTGSLGQCLTDAGTVFYGTEWCPHCQNQKEMFGADFATVDYVDCDIDKDICQSENITGYPTWKFSDGSVLMGTQTLERLAEKSDCEVR